MLGHPALVARLDAGDTQCEALLAEQRIAAVTGAERPDFTGFREMGNVLLVHRSARPDAVVRLAFRERLADRVDARDEFALVAEDLENLRADAGHHMHVDHNVRGIGELNADLRDVRADRTHRERDHVHRAALHAAVVQPEHGLLELLRGRSSCWSGPRHPWFRRRYRCAPRHAPRRTGRSGTAGCSGASSGFRRIARPESTSSLQRRSYSSLEPSHQ